MAKAKNYGRFHPFLSQDCPKICFSNGKKYSIFGNQRCSLDSATVLIVVVVELTKTQSKAKIQITLLIVRPLHRCKAWHLWIGIFDGYLNDYFGRPPWKGAGTFHSDSQSKEGSVGFDTSQHPIFMKLLPDHLWH